MTNVADRKGTPTPDEMEALVAAVTKNRPGPSYQDVLAGDGGAIPEYLRPSWRDLGNDDIPIERYLSPEFAKVEVEKLWRRVWQMVCREEEIPEPGDHIVYKIVNDSFIIVRNADGTIKALQNACLHRGRTLRTRDGRVPEFRCPFHGLTWDLNGGLKDLPCAWDFEHVDKEKFSLPEAKVGTWGGWVFINMDPDCESLESHLAPVPEHFKRASYETRYKSAHVAQVMACNWKVALEAFIEAWHLTQTHPQSAPSAGDITTQYDLFGDNVSRTLTPVGVASPSLDGLDEQDIYDNYLLGRTFYEERLGVAGSKDLKRSAVDEELPEGATAREVIVETIRTSIGPAMGMDLTQTPAYELIDALEYFVFPNFFPWDQAQTNQVYRFRPNGEDPDSCIAEVMYLTPVPDGQERPKPAPIHWLKPEDDWLEAPELGRLTSTINQDRVNLPHIQTGLKTLARTKPGITLATYQESRIRQFHHTLMKWIGQ
jgi:nitrite reductase/ring-hydroxylating ferredoxin subunit